MEEIDREVLPLRGCAASHTLIIETTREYKHGLDSLTAVTVTIGISKFSQPKPTEVQTQQVVRDIYYSAAEAGFESCRVDIAATKGVFPVP